MRFSSWLPPLLVTISFSLLIVFAFSLPLMTVQLKKPPKPAVSKPNSQGIFDLEADQSFSSVAGATIEYNIYIENKGKSISSCTLTALSNKGYYVEVWRDTDQIGSGDIQLIPTQEPTITLNAGEVATLIVKVTIPLDATDGTIDSTTIKAVNTQSGASDYVTVTTTVNSGMPYPSNWIQLGSDPAFPIPPPEQVDIKATYYTNNGTWVFFRMAEVRQPQTSSFLYNLYLDTKVGGKLMAGAYNYDYLLSSNGILYQWNGNNWVESGNPAYWRVDGTGIVLWVDLNNLSMDIQNINLLGSSSTKSGTLKDTIGPFTILRNNISEISLILIPFSALAITFLISRRKSSMRLRLKRMTRGQK